MAMLLYIVIVLWLVQEGHRSCRTLNRPWYTTKAEASFADMLGTLRRLSLREQISSWGLGGQGSRKVLELLEHTARPSGLKCETGTKIPLSVRQKCETARLLLPIAGGGTQSHRCRRAGLLWIAASSRLTGATIPVRTRATL